MIIIGFLPFKMIQSPYKTLMARSIVPFYIMISSSIKQECKIWPPMKPLILVKITAKALFMLRMSSKLINFCRSWGFLTKIRHYFMNIQSCLNKFLTLWINWHVLTILLPSMAIALVLVPSRTITIWTEVRERALSARILILRLFLYQTVPL